MKKYKYFFGVDVSKKTVDITYILNQEIIHRQFTNNQEGMQLLLQWLKELNIGGGKKRPPMLRVRADGFVATQSPTSV